MSSKLDAWGWPAVILLLALALAGRAWSAWNSVAAEQAALVEAKAEADRLGSERDRLRAELEALQKDPVYLERLLRQNKRVAPEDDLRNRP